MSDLQIGLIVLGVLLILMVLGFNWWQDRRVRRRMQAHFPSNEHDPLLGSGGHGGGAPHAAQGSGTHAPPRREPGRSTGRPGPRAPPACMTDTATVSPGAPHAEADDGEEADPACEVVIEVTFAEPVRGGRSAAVTQSMRSAGRKPMRVFAQTDDQRHRARLRGEERYGALQIAVLLADRTGPLTAIEWSQAWARLDLGERFDAAIEGTDQQAVLEQAAPGRYLRRARYAGGPDAASAVHSPAAEVLAVARDLGFIHDGPRLVMDVGCWPRRASRSRAGDGAAFDAGMGGVERLNLLLDVPCSPRR